MSIYGSVARIAAPCTWRDMSRGSNRLCAAAIQSGATRAARARRDSVADRHGSSEKRASRIGPRGPHACGCGFSPNCGASTFFCPGWRTVSIRGGITSMIKRGLKNAATARIATAGHFRRFRMECWHSRRAKAAACLQKSDHVTRPQCYERSGLIRTASRLQSVCSSGVRGRKE
jgi:hypothetical protein